MSVDQAFEPVVVREHDLTDDVATFAIGCADGQRVRVLVRVAAIPVGFVEYTLRQGDPLGQLVQLVGTELDHELRERLRDLGADTKAPVAPADPEPITVVVSTRDRPESLERCLRSMAVLEYPATTVIVVDNAPKTSGTRDVFDAIGPLLTAAGISMAYVVEPRPGLSRGRNCGMASATTDLIAFTDDDVIVDRHWLTALASAFRAHPDAACVTGMVPTAELDSAAQYHFDQRVSWSKNCVRRRYTLVTLQDVSRSHPFATGALGTGANFALRRSLLSEVGEFDVALGAGSPTRGGEDLDMFLRVMLAGHAVVYEPASIVWHYHRTDPDALRRQLFAYGLGLGAYVTKHAASRQTVGRMLGRVPSGVRRFTSARRTNLADSLPARLVGTETLGMLAGPAYYLRERLRRETAGRST